MRWPTNHWRWQGCQPFSAVARAREYLLEDHCRACHPHPLGNWGQQSYEMECREVARGPTGLKHSQLPCWTWKGFLSPRQIRHGAFGHSWKPLRWLQVGQIRVWASPWRCEESVGQGGDRFYSHAQEIANSQNYLIPSNPNEQCKWHTEHILLCRISFSIQYTESICIHIIDVWNKLNHWKKNTPKILGWMWRR